MLLVRNTAWPELRVVCHSSHLRRCNPRELQAGTKIKSWPNVGRFTTAERRRTAGAPPAAATLAVPTAKRRAYHAVHPQVGSAALGAPYGTLPPPAASGPAVNIRELANCFVVRWCLPLLHACVCAVCRSCECGWRTHRRHLAASPPTRKAVDLFVYVLARGFYGRSARAASAQRPPPLAPSPSLRGAERGPSSFWHCVILGVCVSPL
jgi:hypothetical protein